MTSSLSTQVENAILKRKNQELETEIAALRQDMTYLMAMAASRQDPWENATWAILNAHAKLDSRR